MQRVILIHGNGGGTGKDNWFPWLKAELEKSDVECLAPDFPDPVNAKASVWLPYLKNDLKADENTVMISHSSGAVAAMRYAETNKLLGSVLVGGYYTDLGYADEKLSGYFDYSWQWDKTKQNQKWVMIFSSTDDPYIDIAEPQFIKEKLDAEYFEFNDQGHFGYDKEKAEFSELLNSLKSKLDIS